jgi:endoglucanase
VSRAAGVVLAVAVVVAVGLAVAVAVGRGGDGDRSAPEPAVTAGTATEHFLSSYVERDGRVVRRDQGGDTVSEGQAYALLLTAATEDEEQFGRVWSWTRDNLQRDDGLFAWRWQDGRVVDESPAPDADVDIAAALATAADRFGDEGLRDEARRVAAAVLDHETATVDGEPVLVAGPWAVADGVVNPSYAARCDYAALARLSGDPRWRTLGDGGLALLGGFVDEGLPPDWAVVREDRPPQPIAAPDRRDGPGRYGLDAARIPARLSACSEGRDVAARLWDRLRSLDEDGAALAYSLDGEALAPEQHPVGLIGAAGAARAADEAGEAGRLYEAAAALEREHPTYYGAAWLALGESLLGLGDGDADARPRLIGAGRLHVTVLGQTDPTTATTAVPGQTDPNAQPTTTATTAPATTAPTTTAPPPPTTSGTTPPTTTGGTTGTTTPGGTGTTTPRSPTTTDPGSGTSSTTVAPGDAETGDSGGDLSSPGAEPGAELQAVPTAGASSPGEPARRRTGAIALAGLGGTVALAAALGLRERAYVLRSRSS